MIEGSFLKLGRVVALHEQPYTGLLRRLKERSVAGGRTYDALIVATAEYHGIDIVLTLNGRDFTALAGPGIEIVVL